MKKMVTVLIYLFLFCSGLWAVPPAPGKKGYVMPCGVSGVTHAQVMRAKRALQPSALHKEYKVLVIRVEFQEDSDPTTSGNGLFRSTTTVDSVQGFMTVSYTHLTLPTKRIV